MARQPRVRLPRRRHQRHRQLKGRGEQADEALLLQVHLALAAGRLQAAVPGAAMLAHRRACDRWCWIPGRRRWRRVRQVQGAVARLVQKELLKVAGPGVASGRLIVMDMGKGPGPPSFENTLGAKGPRCLYQREPSFFRNKRR